MDRARISVSLVLLLGLGLLASSERGCSIPGVGGKVTAVTYVYEKDDGAVPSFVGAALDKLNRREPPILATPFEEDTTDSTGETPAQYKSAVTAARAAGLPSLVTQAGDKVIKVIKDPKPEDVEALP
jgi:hypothetical protein